MNKAQREYVKKWLIGIAIAIGIGLMIACICLGDPWHYIPLAICGATVLVFFSMLMVEVIGMTIWHWRLMGECKTEWETATLKWWWFWMGRSDTWMDVVPELIKEHYDADSTEFHMAHAFYDRLCEIKKPKWL